MLNFCVTLSSLYSTSPHLNLKSNSTMFKQLTAAAHLVVEGTKIMAIAWTSRWMESAMYHHVIAKSSAWLGAQQEKDGHSYKPTHLLQAYEYENAQPGLHLQEFFDSTSGYFKTATGWVPPTSWVVSFLPWIWFKLNGMVVASWKPQPCQQLFCYLCTLIPTSGLRPRLQALHFLAEVTCMCCNYERLLLRKRLWTLMPLQEGFGYRVDSAEREEAAGERKVRVPWKWDCRCSAGFAM